jgi:hypothetical protein
MLGAVGVATIVAAGAVTVSSENFRAFADHHRPPPTVITTRLRTLRVP